MQIGIFKCTGIMGQDLVHPYIQSTIVLCDTGTSSSVSPSSSTFATTSDDGPDSSREEDPQQMTVILTSVIATLVMVTLLTCTVMIVALVFCYRANISETTHIHIASFTTMFYGTSAFCLMHTHSHIHSHTHDKY